MTIKQENPKNQIRFVDGDAHLSGAALLLMAADLAFGRDPVLAEDRGLARRTVDEILAGVRATGFQQTATLEALLSQDSTTDRVIDLATEAVNLLGTRRLGHAMCRAGFNARVDSCP